MTPRRARRRMRCADGAGCCAMKNRYVPDRPLLEGSSVVRYQISVSGRWHKRTAMRLEAAVVSGRRDRGWRSLSENRPSPHPRASRDDEEQDQWKVEKLECHADRRSQEPEA